MDEKQRLSGSSNIETRESDSPYTEDGVDLTLIWWMLSLTPTERLEALQEHLWSMMRLRGDVAET